MGVMASKTQSTPTAAKRRSGQLDFSKLGPLKTSGTVGFSAFRDTDSSRRKKSHKKNNGSIGTAMDEDSDDDDDDDEKPKLLSKLEDVDADAKYDKTKLGPEDAKFSGELADGVNRIRVCFCRRVNQ